MTSTRALIIDDKKHRARERKHWLEKVGITADIARDSKEAQKRLQSRRKYDLALIKLTMVGAEDAYGPLRIIIEERPDIKVFLIEKVPTTRTEKRIYQEKYNVFGFLHLHSGSKDEFYREIAKLLLHHPATAVT